MIEAVTNVAVGFGVSFASNLLVLPAFGLAVTPAKAGGIGAVYTIISLLRSYVLRRIFNGITVKDSAS